MKRILALCVALCLLCLCACSAKPAADPAETAPDTATQTQTPEEPDTTEQQMQAEVSSQADPLPQSETQTEAQTETKAKPEPKAKAKPEQQTKAQPTTETPEKTTDQQPAKLSVSFVQDPKTIPNSVSVTADDGEPSVYLVFKVDRQVRNFQVLSLMMRDFDEQTGKPVFDAKLVDMFAYLTPEKPLIVKTVFYGDLPNNGVAYTDADGTEHRFAVEMSGEDGSLVLTEF